METDTTTPASSESTVIPEPVAPTPAPVATPATPVQTPQKKSSSGTVFGVILIVVMLVLGAFYIWGQRISQQPVPAIQGS